MLEVVESREKVGVAEGHKVLVYMPGVWDLLHVGHVTILEKAKGLGDILVVGVPSDEVVILDKAQEPIIPCEQRCRMLEALKCVDWTVIYYGLDFMPKIQMLQPDVLVIGATWGKMKRHTDAVEWMERHGGQVVQFDYSSGVSSTLIKERVVKQWTSG